MYEYIDVIMSSVQDYLAVKIKYSRGIILQEESWFLNRMRNFFQGARVIEVKITRSFIFLLS